MSNRKVLLVDDSKSARFALRLLLQKQDFEVDTAESAEVALEKIKANPPEVVFMDHLMPGMNGFEALDHLKRDPTTAHIPVVMCTSNDEEHYQREAHEKGALGILPKPASPAKLADIMTAIETDIEAHAKAPAAAPVPTPEPVAAPMAIDSEQIAALIKEQLPALLRVEVSAALERQLAPAIDSMRDQLEQAVAERLRRENEASIDRRLDDGLAQLRDNLAPAGAADTGSDLEQTIDTEIKGVRAELARMETELVPAVADELRQTALPEMLDKQLAGLEGQINDQIESRLDAFSGKIAERLPQQPAVLQQISAAAEAAAEGKAREVATGEAREIAKTVAAERNVETAESVARSSQRAAGRMYLLAAGAAAEGIAAAFVVNMLF